MALKELKQTGQKVRSQLATLRVAEEYKLSRAIQTRLEELLRAVTANDLTQVQQAVDTTTPALTLRKMLEDLRERQRPLDEQYREVKRVIDILQDLIQLEGKLHSAADSCLNLSKTLAEKLDIEPFQTELNQLACDRSQTLNNYDMLASEIGEYSVDQVMDHETISLMKAETEEHFAHLQEITHSLKQIWDPYVDECEHFIGSICLLIQLAKKQDPSLSADGIENECEELTRTLRPTDQEWPENPISHYETIMVNIRSAVMQLLKKTLDETEGNVLLTVVSKRERSENGWFSMSQIAQELTEEMGISGAEVERLLRSLIRKGYFTEGIAIPV